MDAPVILVCKGPKSAPHARPITVADLVLGEDGRPWITERDKPGARLRKSMRDPNYWQAERSSIKTELVRPPGWHEHTKDDNGFDPGPTARLFHVTCRSCPKPVRLTEEHALRAYAFGQTLPDNTLDIHVLTGAG